MNKLMEIDNNNYFKRVLFVSVAGIVIAMTLKNYFLTIVGVGFQGIPIVMRLNKFELKRLLINLLALLSGAILGLFIGEISWAYRFATNIFVYILFVFMLNCLAHYFYTDYCIDFLTDFCYFSVFSSYLSKDFDIAFIQYLSQLVIVFIIVSISFILFPGHKKNIKDRFKVSSTMTPLDTLINGLILLIFWNFYMLFDWTFAIFAIISAWGLYANDPHYEIFNSINASLKSAYIGCFITATFSLILFAKTENFLVLTLFLIAVFGYLLFKAKNGSLDERKRFLGYCVSTAIPIALYLSNYTATLKDTYLRAITISELFLIQFIIIKFLSVIKYSKDKVKED